MCEKSPNYAHALEYHPDHGGGTGTGRGLAEAFHKLGNQVIITGRTEATLQEACDANPGMLYYVLDCTDGAAIQASAKQMVTDYPALNVVINNAGVQIGHDFGGDTEPEWALIDAEISTNLLGVIRTSLAFLPHLKKQEGAALINVTSGLAKVVELVPPRVGTNLGGGRNLPFSMPVPVFVEESMKWASVWRKT